MYLFIANILLVFFGIGVVVTLYLNKSSQAQQTRESWLKLSFYFLILAFVFCSIYFEQTDLLAILIGIIGLYEMIKAHSFSNKPITSFYFSVCIYLFIIGAFITFTSKISTQHLCFIYFVVITFDGFSQLMGQLFGKRKLIPKISPNKTFAGLIGGVILATSTSLLLFQYLNYSIGQTLFTAAFICMSAFMGDILASWYKRTCQIKDYGTLLPGHGGILDRFDSFIFSGAMYWVIYL